MPRVPNPTGPNVGEGGLPSARLQPGGSSFGQPSGGLQREANAALALGAQIAEAERQKAADLRISEERRELNKWWQENVLDPQTGARAKKGRDAFGLSNQLRDEFKKFTSTRSAGLSTDRERREYTRLVDFNSQRLGAWAADHEFKQIQAYEHAERMAGIESEIEMAVSNPADAPIHLAIMMVHTGELAQSQGLGKEAMNQLMKEKVTDLHTRVIQRHLSDGNDLTAKTYFEAHQKEMDPDMVTRLKAQMTEGSLIGESQRQTDAIMAEARTPEEAREKALEIEDPQLRDRVRSRVAQRIREKQESIFEEILRASDESPGVPLEFLVSPHPFEFLTASHRAALRKRVEPSDNLTKEGQKALLDFAELAKSGGLHKLSRMEFETKFYSKLNSRWRATVLNDWMGATGTPDGQAFQSHFSDDELIINALGVNGVAEIERTDTMAAARKRGENATRAITRLMDRFEAAKAAYHAEHKKNPDDQWKKDKLDELARAEATVQTTETLFGLDFLWGDATRPLADLEPKELERAYVQFDGRIPTTSVDAILALAEQQGVKLRPDEDEDHKFTVMRAFAAALAGDDDLVRDILAGER